MNKIMIAFLLAIFCQLRAEDIYISQSAAGANTGKDAPNVHAVAWFNDPANWAFAGGKIKQGDIVHFMGTQTTPITIQASGTSASPITLDGLRYSAPTWTTGSYAGLVNANGKSYVSITNAFFEATQNGQFLKYQNDWRAIYLTKCDHFTISDSVFQNMYVRTNGDTHVNCDGINFNDVGSGCKVTRNYFTYAYAGAYTYFQGTTGRGFEFSFNKANYCAAALEFGDGNAGSQWNSVTFSGNSYDHSDVWGDAANQVHAEGLHLYAVNSSTSSINGVVIDGNYFGPYTSGIHTTAHIYLDGNIIGSPLITNNEFVQLGGTYSPSNGSIYNKNAATTLIFNNTFSSDGSGLAVQATSKGVTAKNNIVSKFREWFSVSPATCDYNIVFQTPASSAVEGSHSSMKDPLLSSALDLLPLSPAIGTGADLSAYFKTDKNGVVRTTPWSMGAVVPSGVIPPVVVPPIVIPPTQAKIKISAATISADGQSVTLTLDPAN